MVCIHRQILGHDFFFNGLVNTNTKTRPFGRIFNGYMIWKFSSIDTPNTTGNLHQGGDDGRAAKEPGKGGTAATAEPEATGEFGPAGLGEEIRRRIVDGGVGRLHVGAAAGGAINREAHREDRHQADRGQQAGSVCVFREAQGTGEGKGAEQEETVGHAHLQPPPIGRK